MGRCLRTIEPQYFLEIENGEVPAPFPRQQHFWCGVVYWNKNLSAQRYIWFLKLPIDERGFVVDAARQHFLEKVVTALANVQAEEDVDLAKTEQNSDNPYIFVPNQQQLADFNAQTRKAVGLPPSNDFETALNYLKAPFVQDWQNISLQGLADVVAFAEDDVMSSILSSLTAKYPETVRQHLLASLENTTLARQYATHLINQFDWDTSQAKPLHHHLLRALAQMPDEAQRENLIKQVLESEKLLDTDTLIVIAGRHWSALATTNMSLFLEKAAALDTDNQNFSFFCGLFADIAQIPQTRDAALSTLRNPDRSARLSDAIGALFRQQST